MVVWGDVRRDTSHHGGGEEVLWCGLGLIVGRPSENGHIGGIKLLHNLLTVSPEITCHPLMFVPLKQPMDIGHRM